MIFLTVSTSVFSQKLEEDLAKIIERGEKENSLSLKVDAKLYKVKGGSLLMQVDAALDKKDKTSLTVMGSTEVFSNGSVRVDIDHDEKIMNITSLKSVQAGAKSQLEFDSKEFKKLLEKLKETSSVKSALVENNSGKRTYSVTGMEGFEEVRFVLDMNKEVITKVIYNYAKVDNKPGNYLELNYTKFEYTTSLTRDISYYYRLDGNTAIVSTKFKEYEITQSL